ncbi:hypothetical protein [Martelella limonii]|uniref:hypothetical protein n=1 Tax=Martelella limonii TaxID=1647649 RepID=UPI00157FC657|nr:hypothetical protein [Martelella limonii]
MSAVDKRTNIRGPAKLDASSRRTRARLRDPALDGLIILVRLVFIVIFTYFLILLTNERLPDYESYLFLYNSSYELGGRYTGFAFLLEFLQYIGVSYEAFRFIVFSLGIILCVILLRFNPSRSENEKIYSSYFSKSSLFLLALMFVFVLEFYLVRLRAGISILFLCLGYITLLNGHKFRVRNWLASAYVLICFFVSAFVHTQTFMVLFAFLFPPLLWKKRFLLRNFSGASAYFIICVVMWIVLYWKGVSGSTSFRGEHLISELNPVRFFSISFFPILIWIPVWLWYRKKVRRVDRADYFPYLYALNYVACAIAIVLFYFSGAGADDGEAIVRVVTLSSVGAAICISGWGTNIKNAMAVYLISSNSLFFLNTLYF